MKFVSGWSGSLPEYGDTEHRVPCIFAEAPTLGDTDTTALRKHYPVREGKALCKSLSRCSDVVVQVQGSAEETEQYPASACGMAGRECSND